MVRHMLDMMRLVSMRTCLSIRGDYVTHMKFRGITISLVYPWEAACDGYVINIQGIHFTPIRSY